MRQSSLITLFLSSAYAFTPQTVKTGRLSLTSLNAEKEKKRVVVTGLGVVSGCGVGHEAFFQSCIDGKSSLGKVTRFDATNYPCSIASEVPDDMFDPADFFANSKNIRSNDRYTHLAGRLFLRHLL